MFLRRTKVGSSPAGPVYTVRLCQLVRSGSKVRQVTLLNLGVHFDIPQQRWKELAAIISALDQGRKPRFDPDPELPGRAEEIARRLRRRRLTAADSPGAEVATIDVDSIELATTRSVGGERLALAALGELGFADILMAAGLARRQAALATSLIVARMLHLSSEREARHWLAKRSAVWELLGLDASQPPPSIHCTLSSTACRSGARASSAPWPGGSAPSSAGPAPLPSTTSRTFTAATAATASSAGQSNGAATARW